MVVSQLAHHHFWYGKDANSHIDVVCLLPNGICVSFPSLRADTPLYKIKTNLWTEARRFSMFQKLKAHTEYAFVVVSKDGGTEEVMDEELSLFDIKPVRPFLKAIRRQGDEQVKQLNSKISMLIGKAVTTSKDEQVVDMRKKCLEICNRISSARGKASWEQRAIYTFPPDFEDDYELPVALAERIDRCKGLLKITVYYTAEHIRIFNVFIVSHLMKTRELMEKVLQKRLSIHGKKIEYSENAEDFVLKEFGRENYLLGFIRKDEETGQEIYLEQPLIQYKYVRDCLLWDKEIRLVLKEKHELDVGMIEAVHVENAPPLPIRESKIMNEICLWDLNRSTMLNIKIQCALSIMADADMWKEVHCGIFHGGEEVCETRVTSKQKGIHPCWNEFLEFQLPVADLPRMAKVCLCIVGYASKDSRKKNPIPIAWANIPIFNYKGMLNTGTMKLNCKQHTLQSRKTLHIFFNPLGGVSSNVSHDSKGPCIVIDFMRFAHTVAYPMEHQIQEIALRNPRRYSPVVLYNNQPWEYYEPTIREIIKKDTLEQMFEEDKELLWTWREKCCECFPQSLPKLLQCVKWHVHEDVAEMHYLLKVWEHERLEVEIALELLDYKFPDIDVRTLAVKVLESMADNDLEMYFLHLVQALKYESYLYSPLANYLLRRALNNRRFGHYLFWHLKAEVGNPDYALQFGLILEMYCRGAVQHIDSLMRQVEAINKMKTVTEILKSFKDTDGQKKLKMMRECFEGPAYVKAFTNLVSPLDPRYRLKKLKIEKCKYMDSKKKPLWLVFENYDDGADDVLIIFKNGDDLRQDMLTLLSLRLMTNVWKNSRLDYGIIPYRVLSTGPMVGLIEVVPNSETLGRIHNSVHSIIGTLKEGGLFGWLEEYCNKNERNPDIEEYIHNFTNSVIGYSVAMYVLGVGDRHNDNIMMKKDTGQLFHIDFGHFLGNVKKKLGYNREKAKLILTNDIIYCINKSKKEKPFELFKETCIEAFSCLRRRGNLFITIFAMLLSTGIPELNHPNDLEYLRTSLALSKNEEEAAKHFDDVFVEAIKNNMNTSFNFLIHNIRHYWID